MTTGALRRTLWCSTLDSVAEAVKEGDVWFVNAWLRHGGDEFVNETLTGEHFDDNKLIAKAIKGKPENAPAIVELRGQRCGV